MNKKSTPQTIKTNWAKGRDGSYAFQSTRLETPQEVINREARSERSGLDPEKGPYYTTSMYDK